MGIKEPQIFFGNVMHGRLFPKRNQFTYGIYYLAIPLSKLKDLPLAYNSFAPLSFYDCDHGPCDGSDLEVWARRVLKEHGIEYIDGEITLICMSRIFGYVFNPVSFWLCHDGAGDLRAVLCEVHNTFGERHTYVCAHDDKRPIQAGDTLKGQKLFHVSPFLEREGYYNFRFDVRDDKFGVWIDYYNGEQKKQLVTSLIGTLETMNRQSLQKAFWQYPLVTFKAIFLIHWQAVKLVTKGIRYISKPKQRVQKISATGNLTKM